MFLKRRIGDTGPKISYLTSGMSGVMRSMTVGAYSAPSRWLPLSRRAARESVVDLALAELRGRLVDERAHVDGAIGRIAIYPRTRFLHDEIGEAIRDGFVNQHTLDRRASLRRVLVGTRNSERACFVEVGVFHDDDRIVAAELQHGSPIPHARRDGLADRHAARERN